MGSSILNHASACLSVPRPWGRVMGGMLPVRLFPLASHSKIVEGRDQPARSTAGPTSTLSTLSQEPHFKLAPVVLSSTLCKHGACALGGKPFLHANKACRCMHQPTRAANHPLATQPSCPPTHPPARSQPPSWHPPTHLQKWGPAAGYRRRQLWRGWRAVPSPRGTRRKSCC